ncbi:hypothetical protein D3C80_1922460 [compost metagenome]
MALPGQRMIGAVIPAQAVEACLPRQTGRSELVGQRAQVSALGADGEAGTVIVGMAPLRVERMGGAFGGGGDRPLQARAFPRLQTRRVLHRLAVPTIHEPQA